MTKEIKIRVLYIVVLVISLLVLISPFIIPIILGATIALTLYPLMQKLESKGVRKSYAAVLLTTVFGFVISIPLFFFLIKGTIAVTSQLEKMSLNVAYRNQGVSEMVTDIRHDIVVAIQKYSARYEFLDFLNEKKIDRYLGIINRYLLDFFQTLAGNLPTYFILLLIMILCIYSFLTHAESVGRFFQKITGFSDDRMKELSHHFIKGARQVYLSNISTGGIQSLIVATGVSLLGLGDFFLVFFVTLILSFIPVVGAAPVAFIFAILAFFKDNNSAAIILVVLGLFTGLVDNILRPWLASFGESKTPPVVAFICVIGGAILLGFPGLFIGLLLGSIAFDTLPIFWDELSDKTSK